jgi:hypothetical protein
LSSPGYPIKGFQRTVDGEQQFTGNSASLDIGDPQALWNCGLTQLIHFLNQECCGPVTNEGFRETDPAAIESPSSTRETF